MKYWEIIADNLSKVGWSWGAALGRAPKSQLQTELRTRALLGELLCGGKGIWLFS